MPDLQRILHVEDDPSIQAVAKLALEAVGGFQVLSCTSGQEALEHVQGFAPDFILLDVMMPGMDGPQTLAQIAQLIDITQVPVAFMTAKVQPAEIAYYRSLGACDVIIKPFDPMQLAAQVRKIWSRAHE
jgi:two-component system OmpR family response regulator